MHRVLVLYRTPEDPEAFQDYYLNTHMPMAATLPGVRSLRYSFDLSAPDGPAPYFGVSEVEFESPEALQAVMASPDGQKVMADIPNYATGGFVVLDYPLLGTPAESARPQLIGVHEIELNPEADPAEYERLARATVDQPAPDGLAVRLFKGDRGARDGKYLMLIEIDTVATRDELFPIPDSTDDSPIVQAWAEANPGAAQAWSRLDGYYEHAAEVFTDYVALDG